jgi:hypothetical protein
MCGSRARLRFAGRSRSRASRALDFDLDLVMGSSEVMRRHPPHHLSPAWAKPRQGKTPKRAFATSKSPQQRSDQTDKPVNSEQDSCSFDSNHGLPVVGSNCIPAGAGHSLLGPSGAKRLALPGNPVDQTCGIQQRCCLIEELLDVESDFKAFLMKARRQFAVHRYKERDPVLCDSALNDLILPGDSRRP